MAIKFTLIGVLAFCVGFFWGANDAQAMTWQEWQCSLNPAYCPSEEDWDYTTFTESARDCDFTTAYWDARRDVDKWCRRLDGSIYGGYSVPHHSRITTGSCHDPDGGNGLGTLHTVRVRGTCRH